MDERKEALGLDIIYAVDALTSSCEVEKSQQVFLPFHLTFSYLLLIGTRTRRVPAPRLLEPGFRRVKDLIPGLNTALHLLSQ